MALNLNYKPNKLVDITTLTEDQWLDWRRKGIGGSDVAVALNSSPYRTARELYYDKIGVVMADEGPDKSITFQIGHLLEDVVAQIFAKKTGLSVFEDHWMYQHPIFPFLIADVDRFVMLPDGRKAILECKTAHYDMQFKWANGSVPRHYELQVRHYMAVMNIEIAQMLNDMGIPSPLEHKRRNGGFYNGVVKEETGIWLKGAVRKILTDERYTGKMITNTRETEEVGKPKMRSLPRDQWIIVPGTHEAIISEELFRTAQNALQGRIRNVNKNTAGNRANNLFVCGCCGRKLRKNPAKEPHLVCPKNDSIKGAECAGLFVNQAQIEQAVLQMLREQSRSFLEQHCLMQACIDKKLSSIQTELDANTNMTRRLQSRKAELYEQYRAGRISREKFADIQKTDSEKLARLSSRAEEIKRLLVEHYESRGNLAAGKRTADQIILLKDYDPEIIRNFVERVRVYPSGEIEIDMRTSSGFEFVTAS